ncbi:hypothetical protein MCOR27_010288 [Pyricularia oryzae]|uniref:Uncharacterized protein n=1 Tax=Pyricularia grisea TaxID=148305 RepID=A0ABQ8N937_PYRGI|nr:hypothetical protein MCOR27_010288 [Pyricularia oryzae]KAI6293296.1 hypothetical protein MCOR33_009249 [Pyricularia grisea]KAI6307468.1 hypothetical protein MCOR29_009687 [Pyricularia oryzae]KAI6353042.1 hypothetical protein MCOR32_011010 [Pyricularia oryzae]KAI6435331.1 hypothetical protein MCOR21_001841 [Pyricularia oryzae]
MHLTVPFIIAVLASIATAAPRRLDDHDDKDTHIIAPRVNEIQAHTLDSEVLQKRTPVGDSLHVWHPSDEDYWRLINRHRMNYFLSGSSQWRAQEQEKEDAKQLSKQKWEVNQAQMAHDKAAADARMPAHASGRGRGGKGASNRGGGR